MAVAALSLAVNVGVEYAPLEYRQKYNEELTTTDPVDVAYGLGGGLAISGLMTARLRRNLRALEEKEDSTPSSRSLPRSPQVHRPNVNTGAKKTQRKMQQASRRRNRK